MNNMTITLPKTNRKAKQASLISLPVGDKAKPEASTKHDAAPGQSYEPVLIALFLLVHALVFAIGWARYIVMDFGHPLLAIHRTATLVIQFDAALILFPVCNTLTSLLRQFFSTRIVPFDSALSLHMMIGWSIVIFTFVHAAAVWATIYSATKPFKDGLHRFLFWNFYTALGSSGWAMLIALTIMGITSFKRVRQSQYRLFWWTHLLFVVFFVFLAVHGVHALSRPDRNPSEIAEAGYVRSFWLYGGFMYLAEKVLRQLRGSRKVYISRVIQHPHDVVEIQMKKDKIKAKIGQYLLFCCPEVSVFQYLPFILTSAPEEDYLSIHIGCDGLYNKTLAAFLGCWPEQPGGASRLCEVASTNQEFSDIDIDPTAEKILPRVFVEGPFGNSSEEVFKFETAILVGAGTGIMPFASMLKSIWYRMNSPKPKIQLNRRFPKQAMRLSRVYFFWICRDYALFEWFRSLLLAIEAQDTKLHIEIHTVWIYPATRIPADVFQYLTTKAKSKLETDTTACEAPDHREAFLGLRSPTQYGRPDWDNIFASLRAIHTSGEVGVFHAGPEGLAADLQSHCKKHSGNGFKFEWQELRLWPKSK